MDVRTFEPFVGLVDFVDADHFTFGQDVLFCTEVEKFLCFTDSTDGRCGDPAPAEYHRNGGNGADRPDLSDNDKGAVDIQQWHIGIEIVFDRNGIDDEIESGLRFFHSRRIC